MGLNENGTTNVNFIVARYNPNGTLDPSFDKDGFVETDFGNRDYATAIAIQSDGKIVVGGYSFNESTNKGDFALARYNTDGTWDNSFGTNGQVTTDIASNSNDNLYALAIDNDRNIVAVGSSNQKFAVAVYDSNGYLKNVFSGGKVTTDALALQSGKIVAGYTVEDYDDTGTDCFGLFRLWP